MGKNRDGASWRGIPGSSAGRRIIEFVKPPLRAGRSVHTLLHAPTAAAPISASLVRLAVRRGLCLRCPVCGKGKLFATWWRMNEECPRCGVRYSRESGFWLGSMDINLTLSLLIVLLPVIFLPEIGLARELFLFGSGAVVLPLLLFRPVRGLWTALVFLSGGVY